jgi:NADH-quinone oxidoreductase subunit J
MVVLFAVLLTRQSRADLGATAESLGRAAAGVGAALAVAVVLVFAVLRTPLAVPSGPRPAASVRQLGTELMGPHVGALLVVGVLLTVTLLGAVTIAGAGRLPPGGRDLP